MQIVPVVKGVLMSPRGFFTNFKNEVAQETIGKSVVFILIMSLIGGAVASILGLIFPAPVGGRWVALGAILFYPVAGVLGSFISAGIVWGICRLLGSKAAYATVFAVLAVLAAFMPISALFSKVIALSYVVSLWSFIVFVLAVIHTLEVPPVKAWITFGILAAVLMGLSFAAMRASQKLLLEAQQARDAGLTFPEEPELEEVPAAAPGGEPKGR